MPGARRQFGHRANLRERSDTAPRLDGRIRPRSLRRVPRPVGYAFTGRKSSSSIVGCGYFHSTPSNGTYMPSGVSARK